MLHHVISMAAVVLLHHASAAVLSFCLCFPSLQSPEFYIGIRILLVVCQALVRTRKNFLVP